jgi:hypothetical protein
MYIIFILIGILIYKLLNFKEKFNISFQSGCSSPCGDCIEENPNKVCNSKSDCSGCRKCHVSGNCEGVSQCHDCEGGDGDDEGGSNFWGCMFVFLAGICIMSCINHVCSSGPPVEYENPLLLPETDIETPEPGTIIPGPPGPQGQRTGTWIPYEVFRGTQRGDQQFDLEGNTAYNSRIHATLTNPSIVADTATQPTGSERRMQSINNIDGVNLILWDGEKTDGEKTTIMNTELNGKWKKHFYDIYKGNNIFGTPAPNIIDPTIIYNGTTINLNSLYEDGYILDGSRTISIFNYLDDPSFNVTDKVESFRRDFYGTDGILYIR